jgi:hypothetical protein
MKISILILAALLFANPGRLSAQTEPEIQELNMLLEQQRYTALVNKVCALRKKEYYKNAFLDYCLAYGYCQLNRPQLSTEWFDHLLVSYNGFSSEGRTELMRMRASCQTRESASSVAGDMINYLRAMNSEGFDGNQAGIESKMGIPSLTDRVSEIDFEHTTFDTKNRQFTQQQKSEAYEYYKELIQDESYSCDSSKHLLVFYSDNALKIKSHIREMEEYYQYYSREFNLGESNRLITVFYCTNRSGLNFIADKVHNIDVPNSTFGYASSADLVLLSIANSVWLGAMKHELFHLMIRSFIGDIPAWLDEGIACYYESSGLEDNVATVNMRNYRTNIFRSLDMMRDESKDNLPVPTIDNLTNYTWQQFSGLPGDLMIKASLNYSVSYVFVKFLSDQNKLRIVVDAFRNRTYTETQSEGDAGEELTILHVRPGDEILTAALGMDMDQIQIAFENWCLENLDLNPYKKD